MGLSFLINLYVYVSRLLGGGVSWLKGVFMVIFG